MTMVATGWLTFRVAQLFNQRAAAAAGTVELDCGVGDVEIAVEVVFDYMQKLSPLAVIFRFDFDMGRKGENM